MNDPVSAFVKSIMKLHGMIAAGSVFANGFQAFLYCIEQKQSLPDRDLSGFCLVSPFWLVRNLRRLIATRLRSFFCFHCSDSLEIDPSARFRVRA